MTAVGCTNMIPPENAWLRRSNNDIIIGCYSSQQTWQLDCDGHEWKGLVGTCPELCECELFKRVLQFLFLYCALLIVLVNPRRRRRRRGYSDHFIAMCVCVCVGECVCGHDRRKTPLRNN